MIYPLSDKHLAIESKAKGRWCKLPYPNHPKGCPNFGKAQKCPPFAKDIHDLIIPPFFLVYKEFDLEAHATNMKKMHPKWSDKQARCLLYWQGSLKRKIKQEAIAFIEKQKDEMLLLEIPEANGVNIFLTCSNLGINLEKNPKKIVRKIMIIGKKREIKKETK